MVINEQVLQGKWNEIEGKVREKWGQLSQDELAAARGSLEQLVGVIQQRTGVAREAVLRYLDELTNEGASFVSEGVGAIKDKVSEAISSAEHSGRQAAAMARAGYAGAERIVRERPAESLAVCFGVGLITGLIIGITLRSD